MSISKLIASNEQRYVPISKAAKKTVPNHLLEKANFKNITQYMIQEWSMIIVTWLVLGVSPNWLYPIGMLVICGRFNALGALLHDACHIKPSQSVYETLIDWLGGYPIGLSIEGMRYHHLRHHRYACSDLDPYLKLSANNNILMRLLSYSRGILVIVAWFIRPYFGLIARIFPKQKNGYAKIFFGDKTKEDLRHSTQIDLCMQRDIGQIVYQTILIGLTVTYTNWMLHYYMIPLVVASILNSYRVVEEHTQELTEDRSPLNIVSYTKDQSMDSLSRFFLFPRNIGFHRMHHLHPTVKHENLPRLNRWYADYAKNILNLNNIN